MILRAFIFCLLIISEGVYADSWGPYRGVNVLSKISRNDLRDVSIYGANLIRVNFNDDPLVNKTPPYEINYEALARLDNIIKRCSEYKLRLIIDPHTFPGTKQDTTTTAEDLLWHEKKYQEQIIRLWGVIAARYSGEQGVIAGYDLVNEPAAQKGFPEDALSWNNLLLRITKKIREYDERHYLIVEPAMGFDRSGKWVNGPDGLNYLRPLQDEKVVYSPHVYVPGQFTHQGISGFKFGIAYPGWIGGKYWDKVAIRTALQGVVRFQQKYNANIFIGEFSASRYAGRYSDQYVSDVIKIFESYGWSWAYHTFRAADVWDAEIISGQGKLGRNCHAPRMKILSAAFRASDEDLPCPATLGSGP